MLLIFIKLSVVIKTIVLSIFEWPFYSGFAVHKMQHERLFFPLVIEIFFFFLHENI